MSGETEELILIPAETLMRYVRAMTDVLDELGAAGRELGHQPVSLGTLLIASAALNDLWAADDRLNP